MASMETLDLVQSYLTEQRILGLYRRKGYQDKHRLILKHDAVRLAEITALDTKVKITSSWLKELSVTKNDTTTIDLTDPQGFQKIVKLLEQIINIFNTFYKRLYIHKSSLSAYVKFPTDACGEASLQ